MAESTIGSRLRQAREGEGLTVEQLAERSGVRVELVRGLEADSELARRSMRGMDFMRICRVVRCQIDWLLEGPQLDRAKGP